MNTFLKIGIISGLVAGIVAGIMGIIASVILFDFWSAIWVVPNSTTISIFKIATVEFSLAIVWGVILGVIYSKTYNLIPGRGISKGLIYGLFCYLIVPIRDAGFSIVYLFYIGAISLIIWGFLIWLPYGLTIGFLYEILLKRYYATIKKRKIIEYDMRSGIHLGAIAGLIGGVVAFVAIFIFESKDYWALVPSEIFNIVLISRLGTHTFIHMMWGIVFGAIFAKVYNLISGKGIMKGLYYGLIVLLITGIHTSFTYIARGNIPIGLAYLLVDVPALITFGLILGALYKPKK